MKTNRLLLLFWMACISMAACETPQRVVTRIDENGKAERDYYAEGDSAFMTGDNSKNPFLFELTPDWTVTRLDSVMTMSIFGQESRFNVKAGAKANRIEDFLKMVKPGKHQEALITPSERVEKKFRWFYTYYTYTGVYSSIAGQFPVSPDAFLSGEEQKLLFQGDMSAYRGMNGVELSEVLEEATTRFWKWFTKCQYEVYITLFGEYSASANGNPYFRKLQDVKDELLTAYFNKHPDKRGIELKDAAAIFDAYFETGFFLSLYLDNKELMDRDFEEKTGLIDLFEYSLRYEISLPGKIISANTLLEEDGRLVWKVNALRFLSDDYVLTAESRRTNLWPVIITLLLVPVSFYSFRRARRKR